MGYITKLCNLMLYNTPSFQSSFELMGYITNSTTDNGRQLIIKFQSSFELMGYITDIKYFNTIFKKIKCFKALSSLWVI